ncbi:hypothetical protein [Roseicitreum antarcticum]|uniref:Uncharacterized protein n=1 Tax=Roseicitreum antarcticum TaxID=564137 RepID=A0A1H3E589_9RHOB|nr:hypothetical protein [Roseicitreum antarcticum]SDX73777.1 hypothetical protein SAMN04488238_11812 [Roseicitreum antarcticum]
MAKDQLDHDELNDADDVVPVLVDYDTAEAAEADAADQDIDQDAAENDGYDIRDDLDDSNKHVLGLLSDEELAALNDDEDDDEGDDDPDAEAAGEEDQPEAEDTAKADVDAEQEADEGPDATAQAQPAQVELTAQQLADIKAAEKAARTAAMEKWKDGELTDDELDSEWEAAAEAAHAKTQEIQNQHVQQKAQQDWDQVVETFHNDARSYLTGNPDLKKPEHIAEFDRHVKAVTASPRYDNMTNTQKLAAAHKLYLAEAETLGFEAPPLVKAPAPNPKPAAVPAPKRAAKRPEIVPTLNKIPAAASNSEADGKYGQLEALMDTGTPEQIEAAMARLSPDEREAFASMDLG